jgi:hypothetical protein
MKKFLLLLMLLPLLSIGQVSEVKISIPSGSMKIDAYRYAPTAPVVSAKSPVIIAYPGTGETTLALASTRGLPAALKAGQKIPFTVITIAFNSGWYDTTRYTKAILDWIWKQPDLDTNRVYLTGLSAGANGGYRYLLSSDDRVAAYLLISVNSQVFTKKYGSPYWFGPRKGKPRPVKTVHGLLDGIPNQLVTTDQFMAEYNIMYPGMFTRTVLTKRSHDAWTPTYKFNALEPHTGNPFVDPYEWLLQYTLWPDKPTPPVDPPPVVPPVINWLVGIYEKNDSINFVTEDGRKVFLLKVDRSKTITPK